MHAERLAHDKSQLASRRRAHRECVFPSDPSAEPTGISAKQRSCEPRPPPAKRRSSSSEVLPTQNACPQAEEHDSNPIASTVARARRASGSFKRPYPKQPGDHDRRPYSQLVVLRQILKRHKLWARIADDYTRMPENTQGPGRALADEEEKRLFSTARSNPRWQAAYYASLLASNTTARSCELRGLRLQDVDLMSAEMRIRRVTTKNDAGCRPVPLNGTATWAVARLLERAELLGCTEPDHYLFPACERGQIDPTRHQKTWRTAWRKLTRKAGLTGLRFHDLRHHCITKLAEAGVPEQTLMALAGHVTREMLEHYSHVRMQAKREAVKAIDSMPPVDGITNEERAVN